RYLLNGREMERGRGACQPPFSTAFSMLFPTLQFLGFFLAVFAVYWGLPHHRWRMLWLLGSSCAFYMSWNPWLILLIFASTSIDYFVALRIQTLTAPRWRRGLLTL